MIPGIYGHQQIQEGPKGPWPQNAQKWHELDIFLDITRKQNLTPFLRNDWFISLVLSNQEAKSSAFRNCNIFFEVCSHPHSRNLNNFPSQGSQLYLYEICWAVPECLGTFRRCSCPSFMELKPNNWNLIFRALRSIVWTEWKLKTEPWKLKTEFVQHSDRCNKYL